MTNDWNWPGSRWWKFDFHTHTPASEEDYGRGADQESLRRIQPRAWLLEFMRRGIDCVAVTDHNSGGWIDRLKAEKDRMRGTAGFRELVLFPGVELSANGGVHVLFLFDPAKSGSDIDKLLGAAGYAGRPGRSDQGCPKSLPEILDEARSTGTLLSRRPPQHGHGGEHSAAPVHPQRTSDLAPATVSSRGGQA